MCIYTYNHLYMIILHLYVMSVYVFIIICGSVEENTFVHCEFGLEMDAGYVPLLLPTFMHIEA